jgi:DeoR/GlpR family transcriptional regulator of sugar metabolism
VFLDSSSTAYFVAQRILEEGLEVTVITNSLPIMELVGTSGSPNVELIGVCGTLRRLTQSFVGPFAVHTVLGHFADRLFLSVKGVTRDGALTDAVGRVADLAGVLTHGIAAKSLTRLRASGVDVRAIDREGE